MSISERYGSKESEEYRSLFDSHPVAMAVWDPATGRIMAVNDAAVHQYGYSRDAAIGLAIDRLVHPDDLPRLRDRLATMPSGHVGGETYRHVRRDGSVLEVEMTGHELEFDGRPARLVMALDVTGRRTLEEQLRQAQRMEAVGRLAGGIAQEFNNLLMAINGFSQILLERLPDPSDEREAAAQILAAGERGKVLTRQLLSFARPRTSEVERFDLDAVVRDLEPMLCRVLGPMAEIVIRSGSGSERASVRADRSRIEQVVVSLAVNARDAMPAGGTITIETATLSPAETRELGGQLAGQAIALLSVSDTGIGMSDDVRSRVFDPFYTTKPRGGGTGLGLTTVFATVNQSGGRVRVESTPGVGSTFRIYLPLAAETPTSEGEESGAGPGQAEGTILVVEDEDGVRTLVERVLARAGYSVVTARDGSGALGVLHRSDPPIDLVVTDMLLPGMTGLELARQAEAVRPGLRVLYMSGWPADGFDDDGQDERSADVLVKPFAAQELIARVASLIGSNGVNPSRPTGGASPA
jgi:two-component system cell cycle sensor histidine kinase/response regulator CckA